MEQEKLKSVIESLLFLSGEPVALAKLTKIAGVHKAEVENAIMVLSGEYETQSRGLRIIKNGDNVQLVTNPDNAQFVEQLVRGELQEELSPAGLEVLSIVAYRGPITRVDIESIRGVNCTYTLRNLLLRGLVSRNPNPKDMRSYVYEISFDFLKNLGIESVQKLPEYENLAKNVRLDNIASV
jgi:segregation and condensation protein B